MYEDLIRSAQKLLDLGVGDTGRLGYIISALKEGKKFYLTDQQYLNDLISKYKDLQKTRDAIVSMKPVDSGLVSKQGVTTSNRVLGTSVIEVVKTSMNELRTELKSMNEKLGRIETKIEPVVDTKTHTATETKIEPIVEAETEIKKSTGRIEKHTAEKIFFAFTVFVGWHVATQNLVYDIFAGIPSNLTMYILPLYTLLEFIGASEHLVSFILIGMLVAWINIRLSSVRKSKPKKTPPESS